MIWMALPLCMLDLRGTLEKVAAASSTAPSSWLLGLETLIGQCFIF